MIIKILKTLQIINQVFEAEKMNSKKGFYHKKCFSCIKCKVQTDYFNAIEGPDDEVRSGGSYLIMTSQFIIGIWPNK